MRLFKACYPVSGPALRGSAADAGTASQLMLQQT
ncbi:hypothetical protein BN439_3499 [Erwinia amylovora Ea644]|nr:hypothetical protein BN439_3499 [Erwinia amylovora Ea644]CCP08585.1 hypothetical protein BN440_3595 [Erwinia amylovora MR1]